MDAHYDAQHIGTMNRRPRINKTSSRKTFGINYLKLRLRLNVASG